MGRGPVGGEGAQEGEGASEHHCAVGDGAVQRQVVSQQHSFAQATVQQLRGESLVLSCAQRDVVDHERSNRSVTAGNARTRARKGIDPVPPFAHNGRRRMNCRAVTAVLPSRQFAIQGEMHAEAVV